MKLPEPPKVVLETAREERLAEGGFLTLRRMSLVAVRGGARSGAFPYDMVERRALDATVIVAHHRAEERVWVWLRSSVRPPLGLREPTSSAVLSPVLWELPAGLIEPGETPRAAAARELAEELGFTVDERALAPLGSWTAPAPAFIGELHHYFHVPVDPASRAEPPGDGSPLESAAAIVALPLDDAIAACRAGEIVDAKTEVALRRLAELVT
ncbi:MAG: NUDIX domain-containing protein [Labilithrix sp.]|nr:NUDIX domain-containing protein [Labilithrix sp.]